MDISSFPSLIDLISFPLSLFSYAKKLARNYKARDKKAGLQRRLRIYTVYTLNIYQKK